MSIQITEANLVSAVFMDDEGSLIQAVVLGEDGSNNSLIIRTDPEDYLFQQLMLVCSVDQINEWSDEFYAIQRQDIENYQLRLIEAGDVSYMRATGAEDNARLMSEVATMLFQYDVINTEHIEKLFNLKLEMFELAAVTNATDEQRESLREAETPMAAIHILHGIMQ